MPTPNLLVALPGEDAWRHLMRRILAEGQHVAPRGQPTLEVLHTNSVTCRLDQALVTSPLRRLSHRFACAEALWMTHGLDALAPLVKHAPSYGRFSDDGRTLYGAYGPRVLAQLPHVVDNLVGDRSTRQAVLTTWRPSPRKSKDVPCTVAWAFSVRGGLLHQHVYMRSSDAWLGVPYDLFSFSLVGALVACRVNQRLLRQDRVGLGQLTVAMTSSHLYLRDLSKVQAVLEAPAGPAAPRMPDAWVRAGGWDQLEASLLAVEDARPLPPGAWQIVP